MGSNISCVRPGDKRYRLNCSPTDPDRNFSHAWGVAVDPGSDNIYIADTLNRRVQIYDSELNFVNKFGIAGVEPGNFKFPIGISIAGETVYVADFANGTVNMYTLTGEYIDNFEDTKTNSPHPWGIVVHGEKLFICDRLLGLHIYNATTGEHEGRMGQPADSYRGNDQDGIKIPSWVDTDGTHIVISESEKNQVHVLNSSGELLRTFGQFGERPGEFNDLCGIAIRDETIYVVNCNNRRIDLLDLEGNHLRSITSPRCGAGRFNILKGMAFLPDGRLVLCDYDRVHVIPSSETGVRSGSSSDLAARSLECD